MDICFKRVYINKFKENILIIYNISKRHYLGIKLYDKGIKDKEAKSIKSIGFNYKVSEIKEYKYSDFTNQLFIKGKPVILDNTDFKKLNNEIKNYLLENIKTNSISTSIDNLIYIKWIHDIYHLNLKSEILETLPFIIKERAIYWVDFGFGVGSELRKVRPAIIWRTTKDKKICTFIPISSKCYDDVSYFHCDLTCLNYSTAKIECMQNFSVKRIIEPYRREGKVIYINNRDFDKINESIRNYYTFN